ncbi:MAG: sugar-binding domain-containing protein [Bacilli bacterium]
MKYSKCFISKEYPRPNFTRNDYLSLNGEWDFCFLDEDTMNISNVTFDKKIIVPYTYNTKKSGINVDTFYPVVWYKRTFKINTNKKRIILHLDGVDYYSYVYVNHHLAGSFSSGYTRHSVDISEFVNKNNEENELIIKCIDTKESHQPRGKQRYIDHNVSCFYEETTGIYKTVWLEFVNDVYLKSVHQDVIFAEDAIKYSYTLNKFKDNLKLNIKVYYADKLIKSVSEDLLDRTGSITLCLRDKDRILPVHYWGIANPRLYDVEYTLYLNDEVIDFVSSYSGIASFTNVNNIIKINHWPIYLKMVLDQGYYPDQGLTGDFDLFEQDILLMKSLGFNGARKHQKIEDERYHYLCDVLGFYSWVEMPSSYYFDEFALQEINKNWLDILYQYHDYPSVMAFVIYNESWGVMHINDNKEQQNASLSLYHLTKAVFPYKFAISNDGWEHTKSDLLTTHNYAQNKEAFLKSYQNKEVFVNNLKTTLLNRNPFASGFVYENQPIVISECLGTSFEKENKSSTWGYGNKAKDEEEFYSRLKDIIESISSLDFVSGYCITQLRDVGLETNGLLDLKGNLKFDVNRIKEIIK